MLWEGPSWQSPQNTYATIGVGAALGLKVADVSLHARGGEMVEKTKFKIPLKEMLDDRREDQIQGMLAIAEPTIYGDPNN